VETDDVELRALGETDIPQVVATHLAAFPGFFMSLLGAGFLREFYDALRQDPAGITVVAASTGRVVGFASGASDSRGFYRHLFRRRLFPLMAALLRPCLQHPGMTLRVIWRAIAGMSSSSAGDRQDGAELMSVAVTPGFQRHGLGRLLVGRFIEEARRRGVERIRLTTDASSNDGVNAFYKMLGFTVTKNFITREGRTLNEYRLHL